MGWVPHPIALKTNGTFCSLGVEYPINPGDSTSLALMKKKLVISLRVISIKNASARAVNTVIAKCLYNRGAYVGVLSAWYLHECEDLFVSSLPKFDDAPRTSAPPRPKICISPLQSGVRATNAYQSSFSTANALVSTVLCTRRTRGRAGRRTLSFAGDIVCHTPFPFRP